MRLSKAAAEPIRQYLIQVKKRLSPLPPDQVAAALKAIQDRVLKHMTTHVAGDADENDARRGSLRCPRPRSTPGP